MRSARLALSALLLPLALAAAPGLRAQDRAVPPGPVPGQSETAEPKPAESESEPADPVPGPPPPLPNLSDPNSRSGESLVEPGEGSPIPRTLRGSAAKAGGPANDLNPGGVPQAAVEPKGALADVMTGRALYHGNYCGTGQRGEGLPPIDDLDAACQRHDACYDAAGARSCACDVTLGREAAALSEKPGLPLEIRRRALSVAEAAGVMGCTAP